MGIRVTKLNGESFTFKENGIIADDFVVSSIEVRANSDEAEGRHGLVDLGATFGKRTITVPVRYEATDSLDYPLLRDRLFQLVLSTEPFYISEMRKPKWNNYEFTDPNEPAKLGEVEDEEFAGKRYLVRLQNTFDLEQTFKTGRGELVFETTSLPFSESTGTTLDPRTYEAGLWQYGQGLLLEDYSYVHNTRTFNIYNAGDVEIDPRQIPIKIKYQGASNNLRITNNTTGDVWQYNGSSTSNQTILLDGIRSLKNGNSIFRDTNKKLITLAPGWNDFSLSGTSGSFLISFDFRFYYF